MIALPIRRCAAALVKPQEVDEGQSWPLYLRDRTSGDVWRHARARRICWITA